MPESNNVIFKTSINKTIDDLFNWNKSTGDLTPNFDQNEGVPFSLGTLYFTSDGHLVFDTQIKNKTTNQLENTRLWIGKNAYSAIYAQDISDTTDISSKLSDISNTLSMIQIHDNLVAITSKRGDLGSGASPRYLPYKWYITLDHPPFDGEILLIKTPSAGNTAGIYLSIEGDNNNKYHPIAVGGNARLTTQYALGNIILLIYQANQKATVYPLVGANSTVAYNNNDAPEGIWRVLNYYDSGNTNTLLRTYALATNKEYPLVGLSTNTSGSTPASHTSSYKDLYGMIPSNNKATINLSTGKISASGGFQGDLTGNATTASSVNWSGVQNKPNTIAGYGITDAKINNGTITLGSNSITPLTSFTETDPTVPNWAKASTKPSYTWDEIQNKPNTFTPSTHTHPTSIATDEGTNQLTLVYNQKYKLTTGGTNFIFTMPEGYSHPTVTAVGAAAVKVGKDSLGHVVLGTALTKSDVGLSNVTNHQQVHEVSWDSTNKKITKSKNGTASDVVSFSAGSGISLTATSNALTIGHADTSSINNLTANSRTYVTGLTFDTYGHVTGYTTGTETVVNSNTHRPIQMNGTEILGNNTTPLNLKAGSNVSLSNSSGEITISATDTTYTFDGTYNASTNKAATVSTVTNAINGLDSSLPTGSAASKTITALTITNGKIASATFSNITISGTQITAGTIANDRLTNSSITIGGQNVNLGGSLSLADIGLSTALRFKGMTTTTMSDNLTTASVVINNTSYTPTTGDVVLYNDSEFVWTGEKWELLGRDSSFKLTQTAFQDSTGTAESTTATRFIYSISQDKDGVVSVKTRPLPTYNNYSLPAATTTTLGGIKVGSGLAINNEVLSINGINTSSGSTTKALSQKGTWIDVTNNTGTVTSVAASGNNGITISGSPITTSGTITVGLNLSTAINGLGEGSSPANRNDYIVAQYAAGGTTTTTYHRRKLSNIFKALNSSDITTALGYTIEKSVPANAEFTDTTYILSSENSDATGRIKYLEGISENTTKVLTSINGGSGSFTPTMKYLKVNYTAGQAVTSSTTKYLVFSAGSATTTTNKTVATGGFSTAAAMNFNTGSNSDNRYVYGYSVSGGITSGTTKYIHKGTTSVVTGVTSNGTTSVVTGISGGQGSMSGTRSVSGSGDNERRTLIISHSHTAASASGTSTVLTGVKASGTTEAITSITYNDTATDGQAVITSISSTGASGTPTYRYMKFTAPVLETESVKVVNSAGSAPSLTTSNSSSSSGIPYIASTSSGSVGGSVSLSSDNSASDGTIIYMQSAEHTHTAASAGNKADVLTNLTKTEKYLEFKEG